MNETVFNLKSILASVMALLMIITGAVNCVFNGKVKEWKSETTVVGLESLIRSQGVTTDGESWIFSGKTALEKVSITDGKRQSVNLSAIPKAFKEDYGSAHIGGISFANGKIYAPIEDSHKWEYPIIALYDADTLKFTGEYKIMNKELFTRGIPWVIADSENNVIYSGDSANRREVYVFDMSTYEQLDTITFSSDIDEIQGGEYFDGKLYFATNDITRAVYRVDVKTGETEKLFDRIAYKYKLIDNFGGEGEDLTLLSLPDGTFIHTLQLGATFTDISLRHYADRI